MVNLKTRWKFEHDQLLKNCQKKSINFIAFEKFIILLKHYSGTTIYAIFFLVSSSTLHTLRKSLERECSYSTIPHVLFSLTTHLMENPDEYFNSVK